MDWIKQLAREQVMTFVIGLALEIGLAVLLAAVVAADPTLVSWPLSKAAWALWAAAVGVGGFQVAVVILMASHRSVDVLEKKVEAKLDTIQPLIAAQISAARAAIEAQAQGVVDLRVREERVLAVDRANADAQMRFDAAAKEIRTYVEGHTQEMMRLRAAHEVLSADSNCGVAMRCIETIVDSLRGEGWVIDLDAKVGITRMVRPGDNS